ncbi:DUF6481 family protein [Mesorhizobium sp. CAU 1741]|uniref:DUF6481 family protein n=1 Tax=Mesorhizobium sp. CAU 1741 TaxID=3140366 RepID=UPI00325A6601
MAIFKEKGFAERRQSAVEARKALLERAMAKLPDPNDPEVIAKQEERKAAAEAKAQRQAERERQKREKAEAEIREREEREAAAKAAAEAEANAKEEAERSMVSRLLADEADRKAKRDAKYAARKARKGK